MVPEVPEAEEGSMTYQFPESLPILRAWLVRRGLDVAGLKSERQAAYLAQDLIGTRFKFPPKGQSCFPLLQKLEAAVTVSEHSEKRRSRPERLSANAPQMRHTGNASSIAKSSGPEHYAGQSAGEHPQIGCVTGSVSSEQKRSGRERITGEIPSEREQRACGASGELPRTDGRDRIPVIKSQVSQAVPSGLVIYADGACHPNPGIGGWGFVVYRDGVEIHSDHGGDLVATNQTMELTAALMALRWFAERGIVEPVRLFSDSQYTVNGCNEWRQGWKVKGWKRGGPKAKPENAAIANLELWRALDEALAAVPIKLEWCKGHAGIIGNERADELSEIGRDSVLPVPRPSLIEQQLSCAF
jgi:ribonuclease HI